MLTLVHLIGFALAAMVGFALAAAIGAGMEEEEENF